MNIIQSTDERFDLILASKCITTLSAIALIMVPLDYLYIRYVHEQQVGAKTNTTQQTYQLIKNKDQVLEDISNSPLFGLETRIQDTPMTQVSLKDMSKDYRLKGVMLSANSEAIVEDVKTQQTQFVTIGSLIGQFIVTNIQDGEVILSHLDSEIVLSIE